MKKIFTFFTLLILFNTYSWAQEDLLSQIKLDSAKKEYVKSAFKSPRVIMSHSIEFLNPGTMDFRILHRFGTLDQGYKNFYGLDQASMRLGFDFGIKRNLMVGVGRSTYKKEVDVYAKYAPLQQTTDDKMPVTVALVSGMTMNTSPWDDPTRKNFFTSRLGYYFQALVGRKINSKLTLQVAPTLVHTNLVATDFQSNDVFALGVGGRYKVSKRIAITCDYYHNFNGLTEGVNYDPLSVGVDIETGGHVFQLHFSNATGMNERAFINETYGRWGKGEIRWGFNLSRIFQIAKRKENSW